MQNTAVKNFMRLTLVGAGSFLGAYYFDPVSGRRRRRMVQDKMLKTRRSLKRQSELAMKDFQNRAQGSWHELMAQFTDDQPSDQVIHDRIRAVLGHYCSHPSAIEVTVTNRQATLKGDILQDEVHPVRWAIGTVKGLSEAHFNLTPHTSTAQVPTLQGRPGRPALTPLTRTHLPPSYQFGLGGVGAMLGAYGLARRGWQGVTLASAGGLMLLRAVTNQPFKQLLGRSPRGAVLVQKSIHIKAPIEKVYSLWQYPENFPRFMRNVHKVEKLNDDEYRWVVRGPANTEVQWTALITARQPNKRLSWETIPGSVIEHAGQVYFEDHKEETVVHIQLAYNPPAGAFGHIMASIFRAEPKKELNEDLMRMKSMLETGKRPRDAFIRSA
jgi:uncharacterized membrane protein